MFLIFALAWNVFVVYRVAGARDFYPNVILAGLSAPVGLVAGGAAFSAIQIGTGNKPFAMHPILSVLSLLNVAYPLGRLIGFF
jgi:hypothetical protein